MSQLVALQPETATLRDGRSIPVEQVTVGDIVAVRAGVNNYCVAECVRALQCVAVCCSVLQSVAVCCSLLQSVAVRCSLLPCVAT